MRGKGLMARRLESWHSLGNVSSAQGVLYNVEVVPFMFAVGKAMSIIRLLIFSVSYALSWRH
jgi:hypothetical protein